MTLAASAWVIEGAPVEKPVDVLILLAITNGSCGDDEWLYDVPAAALPYIARVARTTPEAVAARIDRMVEQGLLERVDLTGELIRVHPGSGA